MSLLHISLLGGLLLAAVPLLIHLFNRVRGQRVRFPAIRLVDESPPPTQRRRRLEDVLLMLLRMLAIILLTFWIARPYRTIKDTSVGRGMEPEAVAIIVDNSASMDYRESSGPRFDHALSLARALVTSLKPEDQAVVIPLVSRDEDPENLIQSQKELLQSLDRIRIEWAAPDPLARVEKAAVLLEKSPLELKSVYFFTDMQSAAWQLAPGQGSPPPGAPALKLIDVRASGSTDNRAIVSAQAVSEASGQSSVATAEARVANLMESGSGDIEFELRTARRSILRGAVQAPAGAVATARISYDASELTSGEVSWLELEADRLPADNRRYLVLNPLRKLKLLIVDGDQQALDSRAESYYVRQALHPNPAAETRFQYRVIPAGELPPLDNDIDAVMLMNVRELPSDSVSRLARWIEEGGSLFISLGDQIDPDRYNEQMGRVLPIRLRGIRAIGEDAVFAQGSDDRRERLSRFATGHPVFRPFTALEGGGFSSVRFTAYGLGEPGGGDAAALMWLGSGAPMLVERQLGQGRSLVWMSSLDRDWSDLVFKPVFLPLIHRITEYLCGALGDTLPLDVPASRPVELMAPPGAKTATVETPDGRQLPVEIADSDGDRPLRITDTWERGIYTVAWGGGARAGERIRFAVNIDPVEADLKPLDETQLEQLSRRYPLSAVGGPSGEIITGASFSLSRREEFYRTFILALALALLAESVLTVRARKP
ncbi:MAG: BatA and WFA domain-containing protein [Deltaproteobacteria bacterium]|nr:BatA and WFA domain-containing protein [Deltaproteobacteria bacterium]